MSALAASFARAGSENKGTSHRFATGTRVVAKMSLLQSTLNSAAPPGQRPGKAPLLKWML